MNPTLKTHSINFVIFAFNEEQRIGYVIRNLRLFGQVYILDGGSTDKTREICENLGAKFVLRPKVPYGFSETEEMFEFVKKITDSNWIYWGFADNLLPKQLLLEMQKLSQQEKYKYVHIPVDTYLWGNTAHPAIHAVYTCFFRKEYMDFKDNRMHGMGKFTGRKEEICYLPESKEFAIRHFSLYNLEKYVERHLHYAVEEAKVKFQDGKKFSLYYMLGSMARYFYLFYKRGWRLGVKGLYIAMLYTFFRLMVAVKLYEIENNLTLETMEQAFAQEKLKLVEEIERSVGPGL